MSSANSGLASIIALGLFLAAPGMTPASHAATTDDQATMAETGLPAMLDRTLPSVVSIEIVSGQGMDDGQDPYAENGYSQPAPSTGLGAGTGVIVDGTRGLVITNAHVVQDADKIILRFRDGRRQSATILGLDPETDLAVLRVSIDGLQAIKIGQSATLLVGDRVVAVGDAFGLPYTVTEGIVSALGRNDLGIEDYEDFIQVDATISPGNSGGPLLDLKGRLVGINTAVIEPDMNGFGIGFAIPVDMVMRVVNQIIAHGHMDHGALGISVQDLDDRIAAGLGLSVATGVVVSEVIPDTPAAAAGMQVGDVLATFEGRPIPTSGWLRNAVGLSLGGDEVHIGILRGKKRLEMTVKLASRDRLYQSQTSPKEPEDATVSRFLDGIPLKEVPALDGLPAGVLVTDFGPGAAMGPEGLFPGDIIVAVGTWPTPDRAALIKALAAAAKTDVPTVLRVYRDGRAMFIAIH